MIKNLFLIVMLFLGSTAIFAGKDEIRALLSHDAIVKYGGPKSDMGDQLFFETGLSPWAFFAERSTLARMIGFEEILRAEGMLDTNCRINKQCQYWIQEILEEWSGTREGEIIFASHFIQPINKIVYSLVLTNLSDANAQSIAEYSRLPLKN